MGFIRYSHIERLGNDEVEGILNGKCYITSKLDGTQTNVWFDGKKIRCGGRNRELSLEDDERGFVKYILSDPKFTDFFKKYPKAHLYGEWLIKHSVNYYQNAAWNKFYVYDVYINGNSPEDGRNELRYDDFKRMLDEFNIEYIPVIEIIDYPSQ